MSLAHDIAGVLPLLRAEAEGRMIDACTISRGGGSETFDDTTGTYTTPAGSTVYSGKCEVQVSDGVNARQTEAGGTELTVTRVTVKIPVLSDGYSDAYPTGYTAASEARVGDVVTITAAMNDPALVDQVFTVIGLHSKTFATARRLVVERIT